MESNYGKYFNHRTTRKLFAFDAKVTNTHASAQTLTDTRKLIHTKYIQEDVSNSFISKASTLWLHYIRIHVDVRF